MRPPMIWRQPLLAPIFLALSFYGCALQGAKDADPAADQQGQRLGISPSYCAQSGWCWENPSPQGGGVFGLWVQGPTTLWGVGDDGTVIRRGSGGATIVQSGTSQVLKAVFGFSASDIWAVGDYGAVTHYDGTSFTAAPIPGETGTLFTLWGSSGHDLWVTGGRYRSSAPVIYHYDGTTWAPPAGFPARTMIGLFWGTGPSDIWAFAGASSQHYNGTGWSASPVPTASDCTYGSCRAYAAAPSDVWLTDQEVGLVWHYDGTAWTAVPVPLSAGEQAQAISGTSGNDIWVGGSAGGLIHYNGATWSAAPAPSTGPVVALASATPGAAWAAVDLAPDSTYDFYGAGGLLSYSGTAWSDLSKGPVADLHGVRAFSATNVWTVGMGGLVLHRSATAWARVAAGTTANLFAMDGTSSSDLWVGGKGVLRHYDGSAWSSSAVPSGAVIRGLHARTKTDVWAVGSVPSGGATAGLAMHYNGSSWITTTLAYPLYGVRALKAGDVWLGGTTGSIYHYDGHGFTLRQSGNPQGFVSTFHGVWGSAPGDVWLGGCSTGPLGARNPLMTHWDGHALSAVAVDGYCIESVHGTAQDNVWAVGDPYDHTFSIPGLSSTFLHFDGKSWSSQIDPGTNQPLYGVSAANLGNLWLVGQGGTILH